MRGEFPFTLAITEAHESAFWVLLPPPVSERLSDAQSSPTRNANAQRAPRWVVGVMLLKSVKTLILIRYETPIPYMACFME